MTSENDRLVEGGGIIRPTGEVVYLERQIKLGTVSVDSGRLLLADPTYITHMPNELEYADDLPLGRQHATQVLEGTGLLFSAGLGDGVYEVFATVGTGGGWGERVKRVEIVLVDENTAQEYSDRLVDIAVDLMRDAERRERED